MERTWTTVGDELVERVGGRDVIGTAIEDLDWQIVDRDAGVTVGAMPGIAINATIRELRIPKVSAIAVDSFSIPAASSDDDGFYPGFYGIEGNYTNGLARVYLLDTGCEIVPVASELIAPVPA